MKVTKTNLPKLNLGLDSKSINKVPPHHLFNSNPTIITKFGSPDPPCLLLERNSRLKEGELQNRAHLF